MDRCPCTISLIRRGATLMSLANRYWLMPKGFRNSSSRISPGWMGGEFCLRHHELLVVVYDLDIMGVTFLPSEADSPLGINSNTILSGAIPRQFLEAVSRRCYEIDEFFRGVENQKFARNALRIW